MLPKTNRIKKKKDFEAIFKKSKSFRDDLFVSKVAYNNLGLNRYGFVVSQKVSKKATIRNKVRRRLAEAIKAEAGGMKNGIDIVFIALSGIEKKDFKDIKEAVKKTLAREKLIVSTSK